VAISGCSHGRDRALDQEARRVTGGDPELGKTAIRNYGCYSCHVIPGIPGANGRIGPTLEGAGNLTQLSGGLPNNPENMMRWIRDPHSVLPKTKMPEMGVSQKDARDITAYLYTLR